MVEVNQSVVYLKHILATLSICLTLAFTEAALGQEANELSEAAREQLRENLMEELLVTGSRIKGLSQDDLASPLETISRKDIMNTGAFRIADIINNMTINSGAENNPDAFTQNFTAGTSNINLRGLGVSSTLVLLNGRRQTFSAFTTDKGESFVDTASLVPTIAVDRVEILKDGASSLYGSDAVAGVVNFNTRNDFEGFDVDVDYQTGSGSQEDVLLSAIYGAGNNKSHFMSAVSVFSREQFGTDQKRLSRVENDTSRAGFPGTFLVPTQPTFPGLDPVTQATLAATWNIAFDSAGNVDGVADFFEGALGFPVIANSKQPAFADFDCIRLAQNDSSTLPPQTFPVGPCQFDFGSFFSLVPQEDRSQFFSTLTHQFTDSLEFVAELGFTKSETRRRNSPSFPITSTPVICGDPANPTTALLDQALGTPCAALGVHPENPFGTTVLFVGRVKGSGSPADVSQHDSDTSRFMVALKGEINAAWSWETSIAQSKNNFLLKSQDQLKNEFQNALLGLGGANCTGTPGVDIFPGQGPCSYFNPFGSSLTGDGPANDQAMFDYITGDFIIDTQTQLRVIEGFASGELGQTAQGAINIAFGVQLRNEDLEYNYDDNANAENFLFVIGNPDFKAKRDIAAAFVELALPLSATVDLQLALRNEDYDGEFSSTDPKIALLWRPLNSLSIRGSYSSSFRAPSLFQQSGIKTTLSEIALAGQFLSVRAQAGPESLVPEEADTLNFGFSWKSASSALALSFDYWSFDYKNAIIQQDPNAIVTAFFINGDRSLLPQIDFIGNVEGITNIQHIITYYDNASALKTDGIDIKLAYHWPYNRYGQFSTGLDLTKIMSYDLDDPQVGRIDGLNNRNFNNFAASVPELRSAISLGWDKDNKHAANIFIRNISSYDDDQTSNASIASHTTIDIQYRYSFDPIGSLKENILLTLGGINITDEDPPHVATNGGYDSKVHDPRGALYYVKASIPF